MTRKLRLRIVGAISRFWIRRGYLAEGSKWIKQTLKKSSVDSDPKLQARIFRFIGTLSRRMGDLEAAIMFYQKSLQLSREIDHKPMIANAIAGLALVKILQSDFNLARTLLNKSLAIAKDINDDHQISSLLVNLGVVSAEEEEDYEVARKYFEEAFTIAKKESLKLLCSLCTANIASSDLMLGDYQSSLSYFLEALKLSEELGDKRVISAVLDGLAALAVKTGKIEKAGHLWGAAQAISQATGDKIERVAKDFNDRYGKEARSIIGDEAFDVALVEGRTMRMKEAIALAREVD